LTPSALSLSYLMYLTSPTLSPTKTPSIFTVALCAYTLTISVSFFLSHACDLISNPSSFIALYKLYSLSDLERSSMSMRLSLSSSATNLTRFS
jgi:hypothetical protein